MRAWGRVRNSAGQLVWQISQTDAAGNNDLFYVTALAQVLLLNKNESPFWANAGIPAQQDVVQQVFPDYYVSLTQQQYAQYFASLIVIKQQSPTPTYQINVITHQGVQINASVPIPI
jgi:hypothetical protein